MSVKQKLTVGEQIDRAREGRSQTYIVQKMKAAGLESIDDSRFSRKKHGREPFTTEELAVLSEILGTEIKA